MENYPIGTDQDQANPINFPDIEEGIYECDDCGHEQYDEGNCEECNSYKVTLK